jgi:hypothetical protein
MRILLQECSIRQLSILYARLPFDVDEQAFFIDTDPSLDQELLSAHYHFPGADGPMP